MTKKVECPYHGGTTFRISWTEWFCMPSKGFYTGTNGHEFTCKTKEADG